MGFRVGEEPLSALLPPDGEQVDNMLNAMRTGEVGEETHITTLNEIGGGKSFNTRENQAQKEEEEMML